MFFIKLVLVTVFSATGFISPAIAQHNSVKRSKIPIHLPLDLTSNEYRKLNQSQAVKVLPSSKFNSHEIQMANNLATITKWGETNLKWVEKINANRTEDQKITLSDANSRKGIPLESPNTYSDEIVTKDFNEFVKALPHADLKNIWSGQAALTSEPPINDADFQLLARKLDRFYQTASRWNMMKPYLTQLAAGRYDDVRGYYFLNKMENREEKLRDISSLSSSEQQQIKIWLNMMCLNDLRWDGKCEKEINEAFNKKIDLNSLYNKYVKKSEGIWQDFFGMYFHRDDVEYKVENNREFFTMPFLNPQNDRILNFVKANTEDEWKGSFWNLIIRVVDRNASANIRFQRGATAHVAGGNTIVMDANQDIDSYEEKWTIRHEYGHILGLVDCYHEFYDSSIKAIVNYQLDVTDLMCSRAGNLKPRHYEVLKQAYGQN